MRATLAQQKVIVRRMRQMVRFCRKAQQWKSQLPLTGLGYITESRKSYSIRVIWLTIILGCLSLCFYQCYDRLLYFASQPIAVDITFQNSAQFEPPTLTVCYQETKEYQVLNQKCEANDSSSMESFNLMYKLLKCAARIGIDHETLWKILNTTKVIAFVGTDDANGKEVSLNYISTEEYHGAGICNRIQISTSTMSRQQLQWVKTNGIKLKVGCVINKCSTAIMGTLQRGMNPTDTRKSWGFMMLNYISGAISTTEFIFIDRRKEPCVDDATHFTCHRQCILRRYQEEFNCRFPHLPREMQVPDCKGKNLTELYSESVLLRIRTDPVTNCGCTRRCRNEAIEGTVQSEGMIPNETVIALKLSDRVKTIFEERIAYDFTALLCEIGGNLGLNLGLSVLSAVQLCYLLIWKVMQKQEFRSTDPIFRQVVDMFTDAEKKKSNSNQQAQRSVITLLKTTVLLGCTFTNFWFVYARTQYFYSYPTRVVVKVIENNTVQFPQLVVCSDSRKVGVSKMKIAKKMGKATNCPSLNLKLLDVLERFSSNVTRLWSESSNQDSFFDEEYTANLIPTNIMLRNITKDFMLLPEGNCSAFTVGSRLYLGTTNTFLLLNPVTKQNLGCRKDHIIVYVYPPDEALDLKIYFPYPIGTAMIVMIVVKQVRYLNTPSNPCVTSTEFHDCIRHCQKSRMLMLISCSLPYMPPTLLPACNKTSRAKAADMAYQTAVMSLDPKKDCQCTRQCSVILYGWDTYFETLSWMPASLIAFSIYSNIIVTYDEQLAYSSTALICEVGGYLGLTLGLSLLSIFSMVQTTLISTLGLIQRCAKSKESNLLNNI